MSNNLEDFIKQNPHILESLKLKWTNYIPHTPSPKQRAFLCLPHREAFFGGAAGGGKSDALLMAALQYVDIPGYAGIIFRRKLTDLRLPNSLLSRATEWLRDTPAKFIGNEHTFYFPTFYRNGDPAPPAKLAFGYIGESDVRSRYQSAEFCFCLHPDEQVKLSNNLFSPIKNLKVGDYVQTFMGPKPITRTHRIRKHTQTCYVFNKAGRYLGKQTQGVSHRILLKPYYDSDLGMFSRVSGVSSVNELLRSQKFQSPQLNPSEISQDCLHTSVSFSSQQQTLSKAFFVSSIDNQNDFSKSDDEHQGFLPLGWSFFPVKLASPSPLSTLQASAPGENTSVPACRDIPLFLQPLVESYNPEQIDSQSFFHKVVSSLGAALNVVVPTVPQGFQNDYSSCPHQCGEYAPSDCHLLSTSTHPRLPKYAVTHSLWPCYGDANPHVHKHNPENVNGFFHPYTNQFHSVEETNDLHLEDGFVFVSPASEIPYDLCDITVADASHYITSSNLVNANCAFDEVSEHFEDDYLFMFSRLRRPICPEHKEKPDKTCEVCNSLASVPIRMRSASNPGGAGHAWLKERFAIEGVPDPKREGKLRYIGTNPERPFIPSLLTDNPHIDQSEYAASLENLNPVLREQLLNGDWSVSADSRYSSSWFRRYTRYLNSYVFDGLQKESFDRVFVTIDPASSSKEGPGDTTNWRTTKSFAVISIWGIFEYNLVLLHNIRLRVEIPQLIEAIYKVYRDWQPNHIICEATGLGRGVYQTLAQKGLPVKPVYPHTDKVVRSTQSILLAEKGRVWLPSKTLGCTWLKAWEDEVFTWTGHVHQIDDQVDAFSYAGIEVAWDASTQGLDVVGQAQEDTIYSELPFLVNRLGS